MEIDFFTKGMEVSPELNNSFKEKYEKTISKYIKDPISTHVSFEVEHADHTIHLRIFINKQVDFTIQASSSNMYQTLDRVMEKLQAKLHKLKEIRVRKGHQSIRDLKYMNSSLEEEREEEVYITAEDIISFENDKKASAQHDHEKVPV